MPTAKKASKCLAASQRQATGPPTPLSKGSKKKDAVRVCPITSSDPSFQEARGNTKGDAQCVASYGAEANKSATEIKALLVKVRTNATNTNTMPNRAREQNNTLRPAQKNSTFQVVDQYEVAHAALATYCRKDNPTEEGLLQIFDRYRWMVNNSEPGSGKSLEVATRRFFSSHERWMSMCSSLPHWAYMAMQTHPRVAYVTTENAHKKEILKEGLDPRVYAPKHLSNEQKKIFRGTHDTIKAPMVTRANGLAIPYKHVKAFAARTLLDDGGKLNVTEFAKCAQYAATTQRLANHIVGGRIRGGDFHEIDAEEVHTHKSPAELPLRFNEHGARMGDHSLVWHTFRTTWIVGISGTPPDWCVNGFHPWYDPELLIVPRIIASCLYGELFLDGIVCRVNVVNLELMGVFKMQQDNKVVELDLSQPMDERQVVSATYAPAIWHVLLQVDMRRLVEIIKARGFLQQGLFFTPQARIAEEGAVEKVDREIDQKLPLKFWEMSQAILKKSPNQYIHPYRNGEQIVTSFAMSGDVKRPDGKKHDTAKVIENFCKYKTIDYVISENIMRAAIDSETVVQTLDMVDHKPGNIASEGNQDQGAARCRRRTLGNEDTRKACAAHGCMPGLNKFIAHHSILGTNGKPSNSEDCYNTYLKMHPNNLDIARDTLKRKGAPSSALAVNNLSLQMGDVQMGDVLAPPVLALPASTGPAVAGTLALLQSTAAAAAGPALTASQEQKRTEANAKAAAEAAEAAQQQADDDINLEIEKLQRAKRLLDRNKKDTLKFTEKCTSLSAERVDKQTVLRASHPVVIQPEQDDEKIEYRLEGSETPQDAEGNQVPEDTFWPLDTSAVQIKSHSVVIDSQYDAAIQTVRMVVILTAKDKEIPVKGPQTPITQALTKDLVTMEATKNDLPKLAAFRPSSFSSPKQVEYLQNKIEKQIKSADGLDPSVIEQSFIHAVCNTKDTKNASALCDGEMMGPALLELINETRKAMGEDPQLRKVFVGKGALQAEHERTMPDDVKWPCIATAGMIAGLDPDAETLTCTVEGFFAAAGLGVKAQLEELIKPYLEHIKEGILPEHPVSTKVFHHDGDGGDMAALLGDPSPAMDEEEEEEEDEEEEEEEDEDEDEDEDMEEEEEDEEEEPPKEGRRPKRKATKAPVRSGGGADSGSDSEFERGGDTSDSDSDDESYSDSDASEAGDDDDGGGDDGGESGKSSDDDIAAPPGESSTDSLQSNIGKKKKRHARKMARLTLETDDDDGATFLPQPANDPIAKGIGSAPVQTMTYATQKKLMADGTEFVELSRVGAASRSIRQGPPVSAAQGPPPINQVVPVGAPMGAPPSDIVDTKKKTVASREAVDRVVAGYLQDVNKFEAAVKHDVVFQLEASPPAPGSKPIIETATNRAADACNRLTMGISSIVSWNIESNHPIPTFNDMLCLSNDQVIWYCTHYHKSNDANKKSNIFSNVVGAFAKYRTLMFTPNTT